jgi:hypothetical protein
MKLKIFLISILGLLCIAATNPDLVTYTALQTFSGGISTTRIAFPAANYEVVAAAGTTVADATALSATAQIHRVTGADGAVGVKFATSTAGQFEIILNATSGVLKIYAASGGTVNGGSANAAFSALTGIKPILCYSTAADTWICA